MRISEVGTPKLIKLYYFSVNDEQLASSIGLKQDRKNQWYLPRYTTSGTGFDRSATLAIRSFGNPTKTIDLN